MRAQASWPAERPPPRLSGTRPLPRGELAAALATAVVVGQLLFAQLTLVIAACLVVTCRIGKRRPYWLALPAAVGLPWTLAVGPTAAWRGFAAWPRQLVSHPAVLSHPAPVLHAMSHWLSQQFPLALLPAAVEAAVVLWPGWWRRAGVASAPSSPGLLAGARSRAHAKALAGGHTVTRGGCALGVRSDTGELAEVSWQEATRGMLLTGQDQTVLRHVGLAVGCAAIRLRMTVLVADLAGTAVSVAGLMAELAARLGVPPVTLDLAPATAAVPGGDPRVAASMGLAIRRRGVVLVSRGRLRAVVPSGSSSPPDQDRAVVADLVAVLTGLRDLGLRADCLAWVNGCESVEADQAAELVRLGASTGTAVLLTTGSGAAPAGLAAAVGVLVEAQPDGRFTMTVSGSRRRVLRDCRAVPPGPDGPA
jgi:hypothetical protein